MKLCGSPQIANQVKDQPTRSIWRDIYYESFPGNRSIIFFSEEVCSQVVREEAHGQLAFL